MFSESARQIYAPAINGNELGRFDPLAVRRKLVIASGGELNSLIDTWEEQRDAETVAAALAEEKLVAAARSAFSLKPISDENGVCDADVIELLADFLEYLAGKPETHSGSPITSPCAEPAG